MFRSFLSWRYLRHRRTNLIGIGGILVAVGALILILSIMTGFLEETRSTVRGSLSDLVVTPYFSEGPRGSQVPRDPAPLLERILEDERVEAAAPHLVYFCLLIEASGGKAQTQLLQNSQHGHLAAVQLVGIDVEAEFSATEFRAALEREPRDGAPVNDPSDPFATPPEYRPSGRPRPCVVVGEQLFRVHGLHRGQRVQLATVKPGADLANSESLPASNLEVVVAGTFRSGENEMDLARIYMDRGDLAEFLEAPWNYSEILVRVDNYRKNGEALRDDLRTRLTEAGLLYGFPDEVRTWEEFRGLLLGAIENERALMSIMLSLVLLVAGFTIFAILSMMVTEKRRDIGILAAVGATPAGILQTFLMIAFWDALVGALLGALLGIWGAFKIDAIELWLSRTFGFQIFNRDVYLFDTIPSVVEPVRVGLIVGGAFLCALLFAAIPAWKASRLDPLDALRHE